MVALAFGEGKVAIGYGLIVTCLLAGYLLTRRLEEPPTIQANEGIVVAGLAFVLTAGLMAIPFALGGHAVEDAFFEAVSAITTTGLSTLDSVESCSPAFLFARAWLQWCGGLGIAVLSVALMMSHHAAARRLASPMADVPLPTMARTQARQILRVYVIMTLSGVLVLSFVLDDVFLALVNMLATLSTGGFSPFDDSLAALPGPGAWIVTGFSLLGAVPLLLYHELIGGKFRAVVGDPELRTLLVLALAATSAVSLSLWWNAGLNPAVAMREGVMLGVSAQSTTGFSIVNVADIDTTSKLLLMLSMFVGGSSGSTAGGIKLLRLLILLRLLQYFLRRSAMPPHAVAQPRLSGKLLDGTDIEQAMLIIILFAMTIGLSWLGFIAYGHAPLNALFEVTSAVGTVGLSTGITSAGLDWPLKLLLCIDMLLGRLEVLALLVILYPVTWIGKRAG
jgi:trk system potassium uptake protein TrkH